MWFNMYTCVKDYIFVQLCIYVSVLVIMYGGYLYCVNIHWFLYWPICNNINIVMHVYQHAYIYICICICMCAYIRKNIVYMLTPPKFHLQDFSCNIFKQTAASLFQISNFLFSFLLLSLFLISHFFYFFPSHLFFCLSLFLFVPSLSVIYQREWALFLNEKME